MNARFRLLTTVSAIAILGGASGALAADAYTAPASTGLPAVSMPNGKLGAYVGSLGSDFTLGATGTFAVPLADQWGAQVDGLLGTAAGAAYYGIGGHLFWRDPSKALIGAYGSWVNWDASSLSGDDPGPFSSITGASVGKVGVEGEAYFGRVSLEGLVGYQFGSYTGLTGRGTVAFYPIDDLRLDVGFNYLQGPGATLNAGVEWQPAGTSLSLFADGSVGSSNTWSVIGGLKVFFGASQKSLIQRHREDDPDNLLPADLFQIARDGVCAPGYFDDGVACVPEND